LFDVAALNAMHAKMNKQLATMGGRIDAVFYCPHTPDDNCRCRKPLPGLFEQIAQRYGVPLKGVPACGDTVRDVTAGASAGCEPHLVLTGKSSAFLAGGQPEGLPAGTRLHRDLSAFADFLLERSTLGGQEPPAAHPAP
jgi:D-glycero-D-manno-heptose 1,7-bisphosphate phosphatase